PTGALVGLVTAGVALGAAQLVAAFAGEVSSPMVAVGQAAIDLSPRWLKEFAIRTFGSNDKLALLIGIGVLLGLAAVAMGVAALRTRWVGFAGLAGFGAIGLAAAATRPTATGLTPLPSLVGVAAGVVALNLLLREAPRHEPSAGPAAFDRRRFLLTGLALGGAAAVAGVGSRVAGRAAQRAAASRAALRIPRPSDVAPKPSGAGLDVPGLSPFYTPNARF